MFLLFAEKNISQFNPFYNFWLYLLVIDTINVCICILISQSLLKILLNRPDLSNCFHFINDTIQSIIDLLSHMRAKLILLLVHRSQNHKFIFHLDINYISNQCNRNTINQNQKLRQFRILCFHPKLSNFLERLGVNNKVYLMAWLSRNLVGASSLNTQSPLPSKGKMLIKKCPNNCLNISIRTRYMTISFSMHFSVNNLRWRREKNQNVLKPKKPKDIIWKKQLTNKNFKRW